DRDTLESLVGCRCRSWVRWIGPSDRRAAAPAGITGYGIAAFVFRRRFGPGAIVIHVVEQRSISGGFARFWAKRRARAGIDIVGLHDFGRQTLSQFGPLPLRLHLEPRALN